ncbi:HNH endonuclease [Parafrankia discariae]|uniref:HNH endonuclease n=1 Tax=Parafrankia discariae TaxID=365528 RepID=UPI000A06A88D|nr:HNH endonuclease signature motif containing protein [Parafrankia discariae]
MSRNGPAASVRETILTVWAGRCAYCGGQADHLDHVIPRAQGGPHRGENRLPSCSPCGQAKANRTLAEWLADIAATGSVKDRPVRLAS